MHNITLHIERKYSNNHRCIIDKSMLLFYNKTTINCRYENAMSKLASIFGPGAHKHFPKMTRLKGGGCDYNGFYPAGREGGVDLEAEVGKTVSIPLK